MKRTASILIVVLIALTMTACATGYSAVSSERTTIAGTYSVAPQITWSKTQSGDTELWTIHGPVLEAVTFFKAIDDGDPLFRNQQKDEALPVYHADMRPNEVMELVVDTLTRRGAQDVDPANLGPANFGDRKGFRFDLNYRTGDGLLMRGTAIGAIVDQKLHLILFTGAEAYYFPKYRDTVERIFQSIQFT